MVIPVIGKDVFDDFCKEFLDSVGYNEPDLAHTISNNMKIVWTGHNLMSKHHIDPKQVPSARKIEEFIFDSILPHKIQVFKVGEILGIEPWQLFIHDLNMLSDLYLIGFNGQDKEVEFLARRYSESQPYFLTYWQRRDGNLLDIPYKFIKEFLADLIACNQSKSNIILETGLRSGIFNVFTRGSLSRLIDALSRAESFGLVRQDLVDSFDYHYVKQYGIRDESWKQ